MDADKYRYSRATKYQAGIGSGCLVGRYDECDEVDDE